MSGKVIQVIAGALNAIDDDWAKTQQPASTLEHAAYIFDALKAARIAVVELPEPDESIYDGDRFAFHNETHCDVRVTFSNAVVYDQDWHNPSEARSLAAALLAAAEAAEVPK